MFSSSESIWIAFIMGLAGSAHCIGMCGGFAVLVSAGGDGRRRPGWPVAAWLTGKTVMYALLGAVVGGIGDLIPDSVSIFQSAVVLFTAFFLIITGLHLVGLGPGWSLVAPAPVSIFVTRMSNVVRSSSIGGRFVLGLLNGLLPCGLVYAALAYSLTLRSAGGAAVFMTVFGLGTVPVLALIGLGSGLLAARNRARLTKAVGWLIILLGILTLTRLPAFMNAFHSTGMDM